MGQNDDSAEVAEVWDEAYPREEGGVVRLSRDMFASMDGEVINWKGANYVRHNGRVSTNNDELFTVRDAMRELNRIVASLHAGELDQAVLMKGGKMVAIIRAVT